MKVRKIGDLMFFKWVYKKGYLGILSSVAHLFEISNKFTPKQIDNRNNVTAVIEQLEDFETNDKEASFLGDTYRGIGVSVGLIGILIIFFAIAPIAFEVEHKMSLMFSILEIVLMGVVFFLVLWVKRSDLRGRWIKTRKKAESQRYADLDIAILKLQESQNIEIKSGAENDLKKILNKHVTEQIGYNYEKARLYEDVEKISEIIGWIGFAMAFVGACMHLISHMPYLLLFTAFFPAVVGAIHATNSFLQLTELAEVHKSMANKLEEIEKNMSEDDILNIARDALNKLTVRDAQWVELAQMRGIKPV